MTTSKPVRLSPAMQAVQPANNADQGLLEFLKEEVVSNFAALPSNERAAPGTVSDFMVQAVQRMGARKAWARARA